MLDVEIKANGILLKHIRIIRKDREGFDYYYSYYRPGKGVFFEGDVYCEADSVSVLVGVVLDDFLSKCHKRS